MLRKLLPRPLIPILRGVRKRLKRAGKGLPEPFRTIAAYSQASRSRQENLLRLANLIETEGIPGAVVECGVLDGGMSALMAKATAPSGRPVHLFDAWRGLPATTAEDGEASRKFVGDVVGSPRRVRAVFRALAIDPSRVHVHAGWFHETFPKAVVGGVALLHIDCDFYEPTKLCLERLGGPNWRPAASSSSTTTRSSRGVTGPSTNSWPGTPSWSSKSPGSAARPISSGGRTAPRPPEGRGNDLKARTAAVTDPRGRGRESQGPRRTSPRKSQPRHEHPTGPRRELDSPE